MTRPGTDRSSAPGAPPALADGATQQWRERGADRRLHTRDRGAGIDRGATFDQETTFDQGATGARRGVEGERQSAWDSASRVREAWRRDTTQRKGVGIPGTRRSGSIGCRHYGAPVGGDSITRPSSPARRVVEGVTSPSRGQTRSRPSAGARAGSGRSQSSTRARAGSGRSRSSTSARSSGGSRRSSATRSSGSGRRSSASSGSTRSRSSGGSKGTRSSGSKRQNGGRG